MKLLFVRHGDPVVGGDALTARGWEEARILVHRFEHMKVDEFFVSPLRRARETASCTLEALQRTATICDWLQEFPARAPLPTEPRREDHPMTPELYARMSAGLAAEEDTAYYDSLAYAYPDRRVKNGVLCTDVVWDLLPGYWTRHPEYYHPTAWRESLIARSGDLLSVYDSVTAQFDQLLADHGYVRSGNYYEARQANRETLVFFCHYGVTCVLLSHLMHLSPFILWHSIVLAPTSVTTVYTEEREKGIAYFRSAGLGDTSHLWAAGMEPSFAARFCETWDNPDERH